MLESILNPTLVDVTSTARKAGFWMPVTLTRAAWGLLCGSQNKRSELLWTALRMGSFSLLEANEEVVELVYFIHRVERKPRAWPPKRIWLKLAISKDNNGKAVVTISLPSED